MAMRLLTATCLAACFIVGSSITCNFLTRQSFGGYVQSIGQCPADAQYCASRVVTSASQRPVIELFEYYCENTRNVSRYLHRAVSHGCYRYARDEHLCFCSTDLCNSPQNINSIFMQYSAILRREAAEARARVVNRLQRERGQQTNRQEIQAGRALVNALGNRRPMIKITVGGQRESAAAAQARQRQMALNAKQRQIRLEAEKALRAKEQKEHEDALKADNRRRLELKQAQRAKDDLKKEEIQKTVKEVDAPIKEQAPETVKEETAAPIKEDPAVPVTAGTPVQEETPVKQDSSIKIAISPAAESVDGSVDGSGSEGPDFASSFDDLVPDITAPELMTIPLEESP